MCILCRILLQSHLEQRRVLQLLPVMDRHTIQIRRSHCLSSSLADILFKCFKCRSQRSRGLLVELGYFTTQGGSIEDGIVESLSAVCSGVR